MSRVVTISEKESPWCERCGASWLDKELVHTHGQNKLGATVKILCHDCLNAAGLSAEGHTKLKHSQVSHP